MDDLRVADKYAKALIASAREADLISQLDIELDMFASILKKQVTLQDIFISPLVPLQEKNKLLDTIFKKGWISPQLQSFLYLLLQARRFNLFGQICRIYKDLIYSLRKRLKVLVESVFSLDAKQKHALEGKLSRIYQRNIDLFVRINPAVIGGARVYVGHRLYDNTVERKLEFLKQRIWKE